MAARVITGTFGEDRGDHFHNGIDIGGGTQDVRPVLAGELVFRYDEASDYTSIPRGVGSFVVLRHDQDILSVYAHLQGGSLGPERALYAPGEKLGVTGETGHADGLHLHFTVFDLEAASAVNPLAFLPALADRQPPVIRRLFAAAGDQKTPLDNGVTLKPGRVEILAEVYDLREDVSFRWPLAPSAVSRLRGRCRGLAAVRSIPSRSSTGRPSWTGVRWRARVSTIPRDSCGAAPWSSGPANRTCAWRRATWPATRQ